MTFAVVFWGVYGTLFLILVGAVGWAAGGVAFAAKQMERNAFRAGQQERDSSRTLAADVADGLHDQPHP